jgi:hypothetical protein
MYMNASCMEILQSTNNNGGSHMNNSLLPVVVGDLLYNFWDYAIHFPVII